MRKHKQSHQQQQLYNQLLVIKEADKTPTSIRKEDLLGVENQE